jgi:hypothetical protein
MTSKLMPPLSPILRFRHLRSTCGKRENELFYELCVTYFDLSYVVILSGCSVCLDIIYYALLYDALSLFKKELRHATTWAASLSSTTAPVTLATPTSGAARVATQAARDKVAGFAGSVATQTATI